MASLLRIVLPILGALIILFQLFHLGGNHSGLDSPFWGFLLGAGLIVAPFTALGMLLMYLALVGIPLGLGLLGGVLWAELFGKGGWAIIGFIAGGWLGFKFVVSDSFDKLFEPLRALSDKADKERK